MVSSYKVRSCSRNEYTEALTKLRTKLDEPISFLQAPLYGRLQAADHKNVEYFIAQNDTVPVACGLMVRYTAPGGLSFFYCPYGPVVSQWTQELFEALEKFLRMLGRKQNCAFVRLDNRLLVESGIARAIPNTLARTASLQPRAEWVLDITDDQDTLWMALHKHARYNIRLAERAKATTKLYRPAAVPLDTFFELMQTTAGRDGFSIFSKSYYKAYLDSLADDEGFVVITTIDGTPAATGLFVVYDRQMHYVFAGSSDQFRKIAPAYSVIWTAIQEAQKRRCTMFNFGGVTDSVKGHGLDGVTGFKKRFGGKRIEHPNPVDIICQPLRYLAFKVYKALR